ncbi:MAG: hypothetical protein EOO40_00540 [Deltaproteobacteria bacterium]|nr:MAG: hypothetical protein EOO40_00540 [Deltaproteobacteria bacterium]
MNVIQRFIHQILTQMLNAMRTDPTLYKDLFSTTWGLSDAEVAGIVAYFAQHPIKVAHGFSNAEVQPPLMSITLQAESQSDFMLGDLAGINTVAPPGWKGGGMAQYGAYEEGAIWEYSYRVLCISENLDVTSYMYEMAKAALILGRNTLIKHGVLLPTYTGMDLAPDPRYIPENLFARVLGVRCKCPFILTDRASALGRAFNVSGLAIPPASENDNGGVSTGVLVESQFTEKFRV